MDWPFAIGDNSTMAISRNMIMGLSVEMINPPIAVTGRLIHITAAHLPTDAPPMLRPIKTITMAVTACMIGAKARTPNSWDPKSEVDRPISQAIIGGLVK